MALNNRTCGATYSTCLFFLPFLSSLSFLFPSLAPCVSALSSSFSFSLFPSIDAIRESVSGREAEDRSDILWEYYVDADRGNFGINSHRGN